MILIANLVDALVPGGASGLPANVEPGRSLAIPAPPWATEILVRAPDDQSYSLTPSGGSATFAQTDQVGVYDLTAHDETGQSRALGRFTVNLFNANESNVAPRHAPGNSGGVGTGAQGLAR